MFVQNFRATQICDCWVFSACKKPLSSQNVCKESFGNQSSLINETVSQKLSLAQYNTINKVIPCLGITLLYASLLPCLLNKYFIIHSFASLLFYFTYNRSKPIYPFGAKSTVCDNEMWYTMTGTKRLVIQLYFSPEKTTFPHNHPLYPQHTLLDLNKLSEMGFPDFLLYFCTFYEMRIFSFALNIEIINK